MGKPTKISFEKSGSVTRWVFVSLTFLHVESFSCLGYGPKFEILCKIHSDVSKKAKRRPKHLLDRPLCQSLNFGDLGQSYLNLVGQKIVGDSERKRTGEFLNLSMMKMAK